jgi:O-antigen/teichoic acid export membrane protein
MQQHQEYSKFGRQVGYTITAQLAGLVLLLIQLPILTRGLGDTLYGTWALISVTITLITPFSVLSLYIAIVRFLAAEKDADVIREDFISTCTIVFITGSALSILMLLLAGPMAELVFRDAGASQYLRLSSILILLNSFNMLVLGFLRTRRMIGLYTILTLAKIVLQLALIVLVFGLGFELEGVIYANIIALFIPDVVAMIIAVRQTGFEIPRFSHMRTYLKWSLPLIPIEVMAWVIQASDRYLVSYFLGVAAAGIFSAAYNIGQYAAFAQVPLGIVLFPNVVKTHGEDRHLETKKYLKYSTKYVMMIAIPAAFGLSILAKPLLAILTTPEFTSGIIIVPFSAFGSVFYCFYLMGFYVINLVNKTYLALRLLGTAAVLNFVLNIILIPRMGLLGVSLATLISSFALGMLTLVVTRRYINFELSLFFIIKTVFASSVMTLVIWLLNPESIVMVVVSIAAGSVIYFAVLTLLRGFSKEEIAFFVNFAKSNFKESVSRATRLFRHRRKKADEISITPLTPPGPDDENVNIQEKKGEARR